MSNAQKGIKYVAIVFAVFLIITIFSAILSAGFGLIKAVGLINSTTVSKIDHDKYSSYIDINLKYANLKIVKGNNLKVDNNIEKINITQDNNKLLITDNSNIFSKNKDEQIIVYIPNNIEYDIVNINTKYGKIDIEGLNTKELIFEIGAGDSVLNNIRSAENKIDTGTGNVVINNSILNDVELNLGIGNVNINSTLTGKNKFNCGIGNLALTLNDSEENYTFDMEKGIGNIKLNNRSINDDEKIGSGINYITINGGIGDITINTNNM